MHQTGFNVSNEDVNKDRDEIARFEDGNQANGKENTVPKHIL
jgi:hypothetical protein